MVGLHMKRIIVLSQLVALCMLYVDLRLESACTRRLNEWFMEKLGSCFFFLGGGGK